MRYLVIFLIGLVPLFAAGQEDYTSFLVYGDAGTGDVNQYDVAKQMSATCEASDCFFAISTGDNIYPSGVDSANDIQFVDKFEVPYFLMKKIHMFQAVGNHDLRGSVQAMVDYGKKSTKWTMPARYYPIKGLPEWISIFILDTNGLLDGDKKQADEAKGYMCMSKARWKILVGHHPIYSNGAHGDNSDLRKYLMPIINECGVQIYFAGHDHNQELITGETFIQIVQGASGRLRDMDKPAIMEDCKVQEFGRSELGFASVVATPHLMGLDFVNNKGEVIYKRLIEYDNVGHHLECTPHQFTWYGKIWRWLIRKFETYLL